MSRRIPLKPALAALTVLLIFAFSASETFASSLTPSTYLTPTDLERMKALFESTLNNANMDSTALHYAALGYKSAGADPSKFSSSVCDVLKKDFKGDSDAFLLYKVATAGDVLKCGLKADAAITKTLTSATSTPADIYYSTMAQLALGSKVDSVAIGKALTAALKKDDSVAALGLAFQTAAVIEDNSDVKALFERIEDAVVQADEVDGKMLQFEGGISTTSSVITGIMRMATKMNKTPNMLTKEQTIKFANYALARKNVPSVKGTFYLLEMLNTLASNKFYIPVSVSLDSGVAAVVSKDSPKIKVKVSDVLGRSLGKMKVVLESAMRKSDSAVIISKKAFTPVAGGDDTLFETEIMTAKAGRGFYDLVINVEPVSKDDRLTGNTGASLQIKALGTVTIKKAEIGAIDIEQGVSEGGLTTVSQPSKLGKTLEADHHHKVILKFTLNDETGAKLRVHQAFVILKNVESGAEIAFVAEPDSKSVYKFDMEVKSKAKEFDGKSGKYELRLIIGDAVVSNPISWHLADLNLQFPASASDMDSSAPLTENNRVAKPEIRHLFREPEKRPPAFVSSVFTLLCLAPLAVMLFLWLSLGVNVSGFPLSLSSLGFHTGLGAIFGLYYYFWLSLDMFQTVKYLIMIGIVTFLCGNSLLVNVAEKRKSASSIYKDN